MAVNKKIGEALTEYFKSKGLDQHNIAAALGVSQQYVSNILSGNLMGRRAANKWENVFGIKAEWLLTGQGPMLLNETPFYDEEPTNLNITDMDIRNLLTAIERHGETLRMSNEELARQGARLDRVLDIIAPYKQTKVG